MSYWNVGSTDGTLILSITAVDENGLIQAPSYIWYLGVAYPVTGDWIASGNQGATFSAFSVSGNTKPAQPPFFIGASGVLTGDAPNPTEILITAAQASSTVSKLGTSPQTYSGTLSANSTFPESLGPWIISEDNVTLGRLQFQLANAGQWNQQLSALGTWTPGASGGTPETIGVTWISSKLMWWAGGVLYESAEFSSSAHHGTYGSSPKRQNKTWTASQGK